MKILLVSVNIMTTLFPVYPLGMSVVANILKKGNHDVFQFDFFANGQSYDKFEEVLKTFDPQLIGISIRNFDESLIEISNKIYSLSKKANKTVFVGGQACTACSSFSQKNVWEKINADFYCLGQAEGNLVKFVNDFENGILPKNKIIPTENFNKIYGALYDKDILNFYKQFDLSVGVNSKRGCEYSCFYCSYRDIDGYSIKYRDIIDVIKDIKFLKENNINSFFFADSILTDNSDYFFKLLTELKKEKLDIQWTGFLRPEKLTKNLLHLMKETGLFSPNISIDGTTKQTLEGYKKQFVWEDVIKADEMIYDENFEESRASFLFGGPCETKESVLEGIDNIKKLHFTDIFIEIFETAPVNGKFIRREDVCDLTREWIEEQLIHSFGKIGMIELNKKNEK